MAASWPRRWFCRSLLFGCLVPLAPPLPPPYAFAFSSSPPLRLRALVGVGLRYSPALLFGLPARRPFVRLRLRRFGVVAVGRSLPSCLGPLCRPGRGSVRRRVGGRWFAVAASPLCRRCWCFVCSSLLAPSAALVVVRFVLGSGAAAVCGGCSVWLDAPFRFRPAI